MQDSAEHDKCYISVSAGRDKTDVFLKVDYTAVELYDVTFLRLRLWRKDNSAEQHKNCSKVSAIEYNIAIERNDPTFRRPRLPRRNVPDVHVNNDIDNMVFRRMRFPPNEPAGGRNDDYIWLTSEDNQSV